MASKAIGSGQMAKQYFIKYFIASKRKKFLQEGAYPTLLAGNARIGGKDGYS